MKINRLIVMLAILVFGMAGLAQAAITDIWSFNIPAGNVGSAEFTYLSTPDNVGLTAHGYVNGLDRNLFGKNAGFGETGLGLVNTLANEIQSNSFIQMDTAALKANGFTSLSFDIASIQSGEGWKLFGSNTKGTIGTQLASNVGLPVVQTVPVPNFDLYQFFSIQAIQGAPSDVLILNASATAPNPPGAPIPGSLLLLGSGILGLVGLRRKL